MTTKFGSDRTRVLSNRSSDDDFHAVRDFLTLCESEKGKRDACDLNCARMLGHNVSDAFDREPCFGRIFEYSCRRQSEFLAVRPQAFMRDRFEPPKNPACWRERLRSRLRLILRVG